jgi:hypothetical protein
MLAENLFVFCLYMAALAGVFALFCLIEYVVIFAEKVKRRYGRRL